MPDPTPTPTPVPASQDPGPPPGDASGLNAAGQDADQNAGEGEVGGTSSSCEGSSPGPTPTPVPASTAPDPTPTPTPAPTPVPTSGPTGTPTPTPAPSATPTPTPAPQAQISVLVVDDQGNPVAGVAVGLDDQSNGVTDANGTYDFGQVAAGSHTVNGTKDGYTPSPATDTEDAAANTSTQYKLTLTCDPIVTIVNVVRGANLPDSVSPSKTYNVQVTVVPDAGCPGCSLDLTVFGSGTAAGTATVSPASTTGSTTVTVTGVVQTTPGSGGQLKIQAMLNGVVKGESPYFSVCAHPVNYTDTLQSDIDTGASVGVRVQDGWDSDSGTFADLDQAQDKEVVDYDSPTVPPYSAAGTPQNSDYLPANSLTQDSHTIARPKAGPAATWERRQLCIFKCARCGATDQPHPNSGFKILHTVFQDGAQWKHHVTKTGAAVTIGAYSVGAGTASVTSPDHLLT